MIQKSFTLNKVYVIAEAGVNHNGNIELAKELIDVAAKAKADAVKFQAFRTNHLILPEIKKAPYQIENTGAEQSQTEMLKKLELEKSQYVELKNYCSKKRKSLIFNRIVIFCLIYNSFSNKIYLLKQK